MKVIYFRRPEVPLVYPYVAFPIEAHVLEGEFTELPHGVVLAGRDHVIFGLSACSINHIART